VRYTIDYIFEQLSACLLACLFEIEPSNTSSMLVPLSVHAASDHVSPDDRPVCVKPTKKHVLDYLVGGPPCTMVALKCILLCGTCCHCCCHSVVSYLSLFYYLNYYSPIEGK